MTDGDLTRDEGSGAPLNARRAQGGEWASVFLAVLAQTGNVRASAQAAGVSRQGAYLYRRTHPAFARAWADALADAVDRLEAVAWERALASSDQLLMFLLKAHRPERYRETRVPVEPFLRRAAEAAGLDPELVVQEGLPLLGEAAEAT